MEQVYRLRAHTGDSSLLLFGTIESAQRRASEELEKYHAFAREEAIDPDVDVYPMTTELTWEMRPHPITRRHMSKPMLTAQYDASYAFTIEPLAVHP